MMTSEDLKIEIRPIPNRGDIKSFSENLEYFSPGYTIGAFVDPRSMKYATGLSKEDIKELEERGCPYNVTDNYMDGVVHPFWDRQISKITLNNSPQFLFPGKSVLDFIKWKYLLASAHVYKNEQEMLQGLKSNATHYIYDESEEITIKANKIQRLNKIKGLISKLSLSRKRDILSILENENTESKSEEYLTVKFDNLLEDNESLKSLESILSEDDKKIATLAMIKMAIFKNVLVKTKEGIFFFETNLGFSEDDVAEFLSQDKHQEILITIKSKLK